MYDTEIAYVIMKILRSSYKLSTDLYLEPVLQFNNILTYDLVGWIYITSFLI
jgi:hypothetical protein